MGARTYGPGEIWRVMFAYAYTSYGTYYVYRDGNNDTSDMYPSMGESDPASYSGGLGIADGVHYLVGTIPGNWPVGTDVTIVYTDGSNPQVVDRFRLEDIGMQAHVNDTSALAEYGQIGFDIYGNLAGDGVQVGSQLCLANNAIIANVAEIISGAESTYVIAQLDGDTTFWAYLYDHVFVDDIFRVRAAPRSFPAASGGGGGTVDANLVSVGGDTTPVDQAAAFGLGMPTRYLFQVYSQSSGYLSVIDAAGILASFNAGLVGYFLMDSWGNICKIQGFTATGGSNWNIYVVNRPLTGGAPAWCMIIPAPKESTLAAAQASYAPAKTGDAMTLSSGERTALTAVIWNALTSGMTTANSIGKRLVEFVTTLVYAAAPTAAQNRAEMDSNSTKLGNLDATVSSRQPSGNVTIGGITRAALAQMVTDDTGETSAAPNSVAQLAQGSGGGGGDGAYAVTVNVADSVTAAAIQNASVRMTQASNSYNMPTDASGNAAFSLDAATYTLTMTASGYVGSIPEPAEVTGATSFSKTLVSFTIPAPPTADQVTAYAYTRDANGNIQSNETVYYQQTAAPVSATGNSLFDHNVRTATSDGDGLFSVSMVVGATYQYWRDRNKKQTYTIASDATSPVQLPSI